MAARDQMRIWFDKTDPLLGQHRDAVCAAITEVAVKCHMNFVAE